MLLSSAILCGLVLVSVSGLGMDLDDPINDVLHFRRFTAHSQETGVLVRTEDIDDNSIDVLRRTVFIISDLMGEDKDQNYKQLIRNYHSEFLVNTFVVTRNLGTRIKFRLNTQSFVKRIVDFIMTIFKQTNEPYLDIHLVGYGSGADIAGLVGWKVGSKIKRKISRITGLNPNSDRYQGSKDSLGLSEDDAEFVDVTHTNVLQSGAAGIGQPLGHVDFYPNGGVGQPGCEDMEDDNESDLCDQRKSVELFADSILSKNYAAVKCQSWTDFEEGRCKNHDGAIYGEHIDKKARGTYFLTTVSKNDNTTKSAP